MNKDLADTCLRYLDSDLTAEELQAFGRLLVESPEAADLLSQLAMDEQHYRSVPAEAEEDPMSALLEMQPQAEDPGSLSAQDLVAVGGYALRLALTSKIAKRVYACAGVAAAIVLALVIVNPWSGSEDSIETPFVDNAAPNPAASSPPILRDTPVATLTAQHNATWAAGALAPGSDLHPNQTLTLTAGFAEITTARGAVALLEAPATIEFIDNDNAIRLHAGKLVGICVTELSNGFVVQTPVAEITDIGTVFGVWADSSGQVLAEVIVGEIQVMHQHTSGQTPRARERLQAGQVARIDALGLNVSERNTEPRVFERLEATRVGIRDLAGQVTLIQPGEAKSPNDVNLIQEFSGHRLAEGFSVAAAWPASSVAFTRDRALHAVTPGTVISSYVLHFEPKVSDGTEHADARGRVTFSGRVLGLVTTDEQADAFVRAIRDDAASLYQHNPRLAWPEYGADTQQGRDQIDLLSDGKTLTFNFNAHHIDAVRVIVEDQIGPPAKTLPATEGGQP